jgi:hypothetical protein
MVVGIGVIGVFTATVASFPTERSWLQIHPSCSTRSLASLNRAVRRVLSGSAVAHVGENSHRVQGRQ